MTEQTKATHVIFIETSLRGRHFLLRKSLLNKELCFHLSTLFLIKVKIVDKWVIDTHQDQ